MNNQNSTIELKRIRKILFTALIVLCLYLLKIFSFIFIPLASALFLTILLTPLMRWMSKKEFGNTISLIILALTILGGTFLTIFLLKISIQELVNAGHEIWPKIQSKIDYFIREISSFLNLESRDLNFRKILGQTDFRTIIAKNFGNIFSIIQKSTTTFFMTIFFLLLLLAGSLNFDKIANLTSFNGRVKSLRTFLTVEKSIVKFLIVKTFVSFITGLTVSVICFAFGIEFPLFWGILTFILNYIQLVGSLFVIFLLFIFSLVQLDSLASILLFVTILAVLQLVYGSVIEPILMGKSFSINTITILVMLMFWGYLWGIIGLVLAVPISVVLKVVFEKQESTRPISKLMS